MSRRAAAALLSAAMLSACATLPTGTDGLSLAERRAMLESVSSWEMRGRLTVDTGDRGFQGSFNWRQDGAILDLVVRGPLRNGVLRVTGPPEALRVTARGETRTLADPETELSELVGWWLPVASLPHWLLGLPDRGFRATTQPGRDGTLAVLEQRLWNVAYQEYGLAPIAPGDERVLVPRRVDMKHGDLTLRLTIDDWQPTLAPSAP